VAWNTPWIYVGGAVLSAVMAAPALGHFQMIYAGDANRAANQPADMLLLFTHPFSGSHFMEMGMPVSFTVTHQRGDAEPKMTDLTPRLEAIPFSGNDGVAATGYKVAIPQTEFRSAGDYVFALTQAPYYEATEDKYIQQYAKAIFNIAGVPGNWDQVMGLPVEIMPLDKPYANWVGGVFRGVVLSGGDPVPFAEIEVEYVNRAPDLASGGWVGDPQLEVPHDAFEIMSIRADASGTFAVGLPKAGWWGIGALNLVEDSTFEGKPLSQDAVIWVQATEVP
jgi:cobalt/nickel transport protein